jgi:release factor glutamine methyltransferase
LDGAVDLVLSNPPYIPDGGTIRDPEVRDWDPAPALWAGPDGLDVIRAVERTARRLLVPDGLLLLEHGSSQGAAVAALAAGTNGWADLRVLPTVDDLFLVATRSGGPVRGAVPARRRGPGSGGPARSRNWTA